MDFSLNDEERLFQQSLGEFLKGEMAPLADERDKKGPMTKEEALQILKKFQSVGIGLDPEGLRMLIGNPVFFCIFCEEVGRVWPSLSPLLGMGAIPAMFVPFACDETRERLMPKLERAEFLGCFAETEPGAGCDTTALKTTARLEGDVYVVNGTKTWISNAPIADVAFIGVHDAQTGAPTFLLAERDVSPWTTNELHKIGWKASPTGEMYLEDVRVPKENEMGAMIAKALSSGSSLTESLPISEGMMKIFTTSSPATALLITPRVGMALTSVGIALSALEASIAYAKERRQFGKPIGKFQLIQEMLYEMKVLIETSRLLAYKALDAIVTGSSEARMLSAMAKVYAGEAAVKVTYNAIQIHGGMGLSEEMPLERYFRDARMMTIPDGTSEIMKLITGYELLGKGFAAYA